MTSPSPFHPSTHPTRPDPAARAVELARATDRWSDLVEHVAGERRYRRLPIDGAEVWVITWAPGTMLALHDHGGAAGALVVVQGALVERYGERRVPSRLRHRALDTGSVVAFGADHVHEVANRGKVAAVSIHVYSSALEQMTFFAEDPRDDRVVTSLSSGARR